MGAEENKALVQRHYELVNLRQNDAAYQLCSSDMIFHLANNDMSIEQSKILDAMLFTAFPDLTFTIEDIIAEGNKVAFRITLKGTHLGDFIGYEPTGKKIEYTNSNWFKVANGKLTEYWGTSDRLLLFQQLGIRPPTEEILGSK
jgi:steroid delta-isomerase-like uncharacterized protein